MATLAIRGMRTATFINKETLNSSEVRTTHYEAGHAFILIGFYIGGFLTRIRYVNNSLALNTK